MPLQKNIIAEKSYVFAIRIIRLNRYLNKQTSQYDISRQILRSGTSVGANIEEAVGAESTKDFLHKLSISYKEARETRYWLRLLRDSRILDKKIASSMLNDCEDILAVLGKIISTTKTNLFKRKKRHN